MKSVIFICNSLVTGGAEKQTIALANGLHRRGYTVILVYLYDKHDLLGELDAGMKDNIFYLPRSSYLDFSVINRIKNLIKHFAVKNIIAVNQLPFTYAVFVRGLNLDINIIASFHSTKFLGMDAVRFYANTWMLFKLASKVVYVCRNQMDYWAQRMLHLPGKGQYIYNGIDTGKFAVQPPEVGNNLREFLGIPETSIVLLSIAMLRPEKCHVDMVRVLKKLRDDHIDAYLVCAGEGPEKNAIIALAGSLSVTDRLKLVGRISDVRDYLAAADATLILSNSVETFSIAVLESLSSGCPVLAYDIGGIREQILEKDFGEVFVYGDEAGLINAIKNLKQGKTADIKEKMHERIDQLFSEQGMISEYEKILI